MRWFLAGVAATILGGTLIALLVFFLILPHLDWGADQDPPTLEMAFVRPVIGDWISRNSTSEIDPVPATPENLKAAHNEYEEHCAPCHGSDGSGRNEFGAQFYPPVPRLTGDTQKLSDGQLYFIVKNGFASTGMPAFGPHHSQEDLWRMVLWVRHLAVDIPGARTEIRNSPEEEHDHRGY
jgi:mono/diheme cytochrome c family protein